MKVGDYVRTKNGIIGKIESKNLIGYNDWIIDTLYYNDDEIIDDWTCGVKEYDILKSSQNIIDLIEVGDYVNGLKVSSVDETYYGRKDKAIYCDYCENKETGKWTMIYDDEIKSIVTKEQFEAIKYEVN